MDIGVVGAGGIGGYYAGILSRAGQHVRLLARGDHLDAMRQHGLEVRTADGSFTVHPEVSDDGTLVANCEFVLVAVKSYSLNDVGPTIAAAAKNGATIVPLLNGADVPERLESLGVPTTAIVGGIVKASLARVAPGVVQRRSPGDGVTIGELDRRASDRTSRLADALTQAGSTARVSDDIVHDLWRKFAFIVPMATVCGLARQPMGPVLAADAGRKLLSATLREVVMVARAVAGTLDDADEAQVRDELFGIGPAIKPSFLLDLERGGPTELDLLSGTVRRLGRRHGVPTPIADLATSVFEVATTPTA